MKYGMIMIGWILAGAWPLLAGDPVVSNVRASQRAGTKQVDVHYDLAGTGPYMVSVEVSQDGGSTYAVPAGSFSGDVGLDVTTGADKHLVWDAGADWADQYSTSVKFKVTASDIPPAPPGMAFIPAGNFLMGDSAGGGSSNELPVHNISVSAFYMDRYEVTKALWDEVANWAAANGYDISAASAGGEAANHPAYYISWYEALKWCNARSQKEGLTPCYTVGGAVYKTGQSAPDCDFSASGYRLPTEAEWEKAARGGLDGRRFSWGDTISHSQANYYSSSSYSYDVSPTRGYHPAYFSGSMSYTSPVGSFPANGYGLYDMMGNLWEWCHDWYSNTYYSSSPSSDPRGPISGSYRMARGGGWLNSAFSCRTAYRNCYSPATNGHYLGFRSARSSAP
jgi:formylglycine-generating enzyme required for sulfatase activity